ncbi:MAG: RNA polymerase sigma-70 factor [Mangrovibacterium sp.]
MTNIDHTTELLKRISGNPDEKAFKELFDLYAFRLVRFANTFLNNYELSEEVVSDVFFKLWIHRETLVQLGNFEAYLFKAARNTALNYLEHERRQNAECLEDLNVDVVVDQISPEISMITEELRLAVEKAINDLPPRCKLIYNLAKVEKMRYKEIADVLNVSVKTIDNQIAIAIKKIAEVIRGHLDDQNSDIPFTLLLQMFVPSE